MENETQFYISLLLSFVVVQWFLGKIRREQRQRKRFERSWRDFLQQNPHWHWLNSSRYKKNAFRIWDEDEG